MSKLTSKVVGLGIDILAGMVIVIGLAWSTYMFLRLQMAEDHYETYKIRIGRSLLLGLEVVVAADIVKTIAVEPSLMSLAFPAWLPGWHRSRPSGLLPARSTNSLPN